MSYQSSPRIGLPLLVPGQGQKDTVHNEALILIDAGLSAGAESFGLNAPVPTPAIGQCWIIGPAPQQEWADHAGALAVYTGGGWRFIKPVEGMRVWLKDQRLWALRQLDEWTVGDEFASRLIVSGRQVVSERQPSVALPSGGSTLDLEARAAISAIVERLIAHGLIEE